MKIIFFACTSIFACILTCNADNSFKDYVWQMIELESKKIEDCDKNDYTKLAEYHADRADSFLLNESISLAIEDFSISQYYAEKLSDKDLTKILNFRALFGNLFCFGLKGDQKSITNISNQLFEIIHSSECTSCLDNIISSNRTSSFQNVKSNYARLSDVPIYGPETISIQDCLDMVNNTNSFAKILILKSPANVRGTLNFILDELTNSARRCCKGGGLWKACFQPLANKYHTWNQKWQVFGIPPDPTWD